MKKKILIFHPCLAPYRIDFYNSLAGRYDIKAGLFGSEETLAGLGFDVAYVNSQAEFDYRYYKGGVRLGNHLITTTYYKLIKSFRPDVVFASELGVNTLIAIALKKLFGYRILVNIDDSVPMATNCGGMREKLRRFVLHHIDGAVLVNPMVRDFLKQKYPKSKCKFIYFPIIQDDTKLSAKIDCAKDKAEAYVQEHGLQGKQIVLFVGRLEQVKCPDMLLRAFHRTVSEDSVLVMVGTGSLANVLKVAQAQYHDSKKVIFTGKLTGEDLYAWYYLADTFVLPSQFEPFGAVVNEALVAGCYTIVTENVGAECLINKENGSVIKANDEDALVKAVDESLTRGSTKRHESRMDHPFARYFDKIVGFMEES